MPTTRDPGSPLTREDFLAQAEDRREERHERKTAPWTSSKRAAAASLGARSWTDERRRLCEALREVGIRAGRLSIPDMRAIVCLYGRRVSIDEVAGVVGVSVDEATALLWSLVDRGRAHALDPGWWTA